MITTGRVRSLRCWRGSLKPTHLKNKMQIHLQELRAVRGSIYNLHFEVA
jgi:hypothetical protein